MNISSNVTTNSNLKLYNGPMVVEGYLKKKNNLEQKLTKNNVNNVNSGEFSMRYCKLNVSDKTFSYKENKDDPEQKKVFTKKNLQGFSINLSEEDRDACEFPYGFKLTTPTKSIIFYSISFDDFYRWVRVLTYMFKGTDISLNQLLKWDQKQTGRSTYFTKEIAQLGGNKEIFTNMTGGNISQSVQVNNYNKNNNNNNNNDKIRKISVMDLNLNNETSGSPKRTTPFQKENINNDEQESEFSFCKENFFAGDVMANPKVSNTTNNNNNNNILSHISPQKLSNESPNNTNNERLPRASPNDRKSRVGNSSNSPTPNNQYNSNQSNKSNNQYNSNNQNNQNNQSKYNSISNDGDKSPKYGKLKNLFANENMNEEWQVTNEKSPIKTKLQSANYSNNNQNKDKIYREITDKDFARSFLGTTIYDNTNQHIKQSNDKANKIMLENLHFSVSNIPNINAKEKENSYLKDSFMKENNNVVQHGGNKPNFRDQNLGDISGISIIGGKDMLIQSQIDINDSIQGNQNYVGNQINNQFNNITNINEKDATFEGTKKVLSNGKKMEVKKKVFENDLNDWTMTLTVPEPLLNKKSDSESDKKAISLADKISKLNKDITKENNLHKDINVYKERNKSSNNIKTTEAVNIDYSKSVALKESYNQYVDLNNIIDKNIKKIDSNSITGAGSKSILPNKLNYKQPRDKVVDSYAIKSHLINPKSDLVELRKDNDHIVYSNTYKFKQSTIVGHEDFHQPIKNRQANTLFSQEEDESEIKYGNNIENNENSGNQYVMQKELFLIPNNSNNNNMREPEFNYVNPSLSNIEDIRSNDKNTYQSNQSNQFLGLGNGYEQSINNLSNISTNNVLNTNNISNLDVDEAWDESAINNDQNSFNISNILKY